MIESIQARYNEWAVAQVQAPYRSGHVHASMVGHPCVRFHVFNLLRGEDRPRMTPHLAVLLREGKLHEEDVRRRLSEIGFPVLRAETPWYNDDLGLSGRPDGFIEIERKTYIIEIKALGPMYDRINSVADFNDGPVFARKYPSQLECYIRAFGAAGGIWVLKSKATGDFRFIEQLASEELWGSIQGRCKAVQLWSADLKGSDLLTASEESLPPTCDEPEWCADCPWRGSLCHAPIATKGVIVADDSTLEALLTERASIADIAKHYEDLDKAVKEQIKARIEEPKGTLLCGKWALSKRTQTRKSVKIPEGFAVPAEWNQTSTYPVTTIKEMSDE